MKAQCIGELPSGENNVKVAQENHAEKSVNHNSKSHPDRFIRDPPMNPYHIIYQEAHLLDEIKDIRDEMNMLRTLVEAQDSVWKQAFILDNPSDSSSWSNICTPRQVLQELEDMKVEAEMIQDAVGTPFSAQTLRNKLTYFIFIDRHTVRSTAKTSHYQGGRVRTSTSKRHRKAIQHYSSLHDCDDCFCKEYLPWNCKVKTNKPLQLPLSFLNSLFALDVSVFPHESNDLKYPGWWIFPMICMPQLEIHFFLLQKLQKPC